MKKMSRLKKVLFCMIVVVVSIVKRNHVNCFNLSPKPNYVIKDPDLATELPKVHASYFGFTLVLRPLGLIVGAPRAQSTLELQRKVNETGAIYRCGFSNGSCMPYVFDYEGNQIIEYAEYTYDSTKRDNQWLGGSMDGGIHDTDKLVVCAPRFIAPSAKDYHMHGRCYWINDTLSEKPTNVVKISPLRLKTEQVVGYKDQAYYYYIYAEEGLSAHISDNNEEMLIGAPGIHTWKGSAIRVKKQIQSENPDISRRDLRSKRLPRQSGYEREEYIYDPEVLRHDKWSQSNDSYFGYSIASGYFDSNDNTKLSYVATAPQAQEQNGEAYIFDVSSRTIIKNYVFRGAQFGEYFGYAVLAEDLNNDGLSDVIVSAPLHSNGESFDNGAIYVFMNKGRYVFERKMLLSPVPREARFGTTLSKLGDINHDGYNDIAVGAPFAGNGSVFIYLGGPKGLRDQPSQQLNAPVGLRLPFGGTYMYGHGLSKGSDIDGNGFNDFAVGAPNAEKVFVYRSYPVISVVASLRPQTREIKPDQTKFQITACYSISTTSTQVSSQEIAFRIVVDPQVKRVKFSSTQNNEMKFNATAGRTAQCRVLDCDVRNSIADIFKPIDLEMHYDVIHAVPNSEEFCESCVAVDSAEPKVYTEKVIFSTGCATEICVADLAVKSSGLEHAFILGSRRTFNVKYEVSNSGETAYLPQINITSSNRLPFAKTPSNCRLYNEVVLVCDLNKGQPMVKGKSDSIDIIFDVSGVTGTNMILIAEVYSTGKENTPANNIVKDVITLKQFTQIDATGGAMTPLTSLEEVKGSINIANAYEIKSNGPTVVDTLEVAFYIPVAYRVLGTSKVIQIIDMTNITMQAVYDAQIVGIDFYENSTQLIMNAYELSSSIMNVVKTKNVMKFDSNDLNYHVLDLNKDEVLSGDSVLTATITKSRSRREAQQETASKSQYAQISQKRSFDLLEENMKSKLKPNKTIVFNCNDPEMTICVKAVLKVYNFKPQKPITVSMKYHVHLNEINEILIDPWEFFVTLIGLSVKKIGDPTGQELAVIKRIDYHIVSKHSIKGVPLWIIILAIIGGLLLLAAMTYVLYKKGFFKRTARENMAKLGKADEIEPEAETLNSNTSN